MFLAGQFEAAAERFDLLRDSHPGGEDVEAVASLAIAAWEEVLRRTIDDGQLDPRAWPGYVGSVVSDDSWGVGGLPELSRSWLASVDRFVEIGTELGWEPDASTRLLWLSGKLLYDIGDNPGARARWTQVVERCPDLPETTVADAYIRMSYEAESDQEGMRSWLEDSEARAGCPALTGADAHAGAALLAQQAEELFAEGDYNEAAQRYVQLATESANDDFLATLGLFNAALIYEQQLGDRARAVQLFEQLINEYPGSERTAEALVRVVTLARRLFDFDRAIAALLALDEAGVDVSAYVESPLLEAADLFAQQQRFSEAADAYSRWLDAHADADRAPAVAWRIGVMHDLAGHGDDMVAAMQRFRTAYGDSSSSAYIDVDTAVLDALMRSARHAESRGDADGTVVLRRQLLTEYEQRRPASTIAQSLAAEAAYELALTDHGAWAAVELGKTRESHETGMQALEEGLRSLERALNEVIDYGSPEWTVCAFWKMGAWQYELATRALAGADSSDAGNWDADYLTQLDEQIGRYEDAARNTWRTGYGLAEQIEQYDLCAFELSRSLNEFVEPRPLLVPVEMHLPPLDMVSASGPPLELNASRDALQHVVDMAREQL